MRYVLATSKQFANGLGLDVHLRTTKLGEYSFSEAIAVRVGNTTLEVHVNPEVGEPQIYLDGSKKQAEELPLQLPVGNLVLSSVEGDLVENRQDVLRLHGEEMLDLSYFVTSKKYLSFSLESDHMSDTRGLMGTNEVPSRTLSRSGVDMDATKENQIGADQFGLEWQVKLDDPRLFHQARAPQWPETCIMPSYSGEADAAVRASRRLRATDPKLVAMADEACSKIANKEDYDDCFVDVVATGDAALADLY